MDEVKTLPGLVMHLQNANAKPTFMKKKGIHGKHTPGNHFTLVSKNSSPFSKKRVSKKVSVLGS